MYSLNLFTYNVATKNLQNKYIYLTFPFSNICTKFSCTGQLWLINENKRSN